MRVSLMGNALSPKPVVMLFSLSSSPPDNCPAPAIKDDINDGIIGTLASSLGTVFGVFILTIITMICDVSQSNDETK